MATTNKPSENPSPDREQSMKIDATNSTPSHIGAKLGIASSQLTKTLLTEQSVYNMNSDTHGVKILGEPRMGDTYTLRGNDDDKSGYTLIRVRDGKTEAVNIPREEVFTPERPILSRFPLASVKNKSGNYEVNFGLNPIQLNGVPVEIRTNNIKTFEQELGKLIERTGIALDTEFKKQGLEKTTFNKLADYFKEPGEIMTRYIGEYGDKFLNQLSLNGKPLTPEQKKEFVDKFSREFQTMLEPKKLATQK